MIIYIHGFASSGFGSKPQKFKEYFEEEIITISLPTIPNLAIDTLEQIIEFSLNKEEPVYLVGSSLGGFYALYLANKYDLKAVLINPAVNPWGTLDRYEGVDFVTNYYDNSRFEFTKNHIKSLKNYEVDFLKNPQNQNIQQSQQNLGQVFHIALKNGLTSQCSKQEILPLG